MHRLLVQCSMLFMLARAAPTKSDEETRGVSPAGHMVLEAEDAGKDAPRKAEDCVKKWMTAGNKPKIEYNPYIQLPIQPNVKARSFWVHVGQQTQEEWHYLYDARPKGGA